MRYLWTLLGFAYVAHVLVANLHVVAIGGYWSSFVIVFLGLLLTALAAFYGVRALALSDPTYRSVVQTIADTKALSLPEARQLVEVALRDSVRFAVTKRLPGQAGIPSGVVGTSAELFAEYQAIEALRGELRIALDLVGPSELDAAFLRIGVDHDDVELAVKPGEEGVYELDYEGVQATFPSIYHCLALSARILGAV